MVWQRLSGVGGLNQCTEPLFVYSDVFAQTTDHCWTVIVIELLSFYSPFNKN